MMASNLMRLLRSGALVALAVLPMAGVAGDIPGPVDGCFDAHGRPVVSVDDALLPVLARASLEGGEPVLRVNTNVMRRLSPGGRLFFLAYECARHALGLSLDAPPTAERARRADCWALAALQGSGALSGRGAVRELEAELTLSEDEWRLLPGPPRSIDLESCQARGVLRMPLAEAPSPALQASDRCVHACGDRLWQCQKRCAAASCRARCEAVYDMCEADCPLP